MITNVRANRDNFNVTNFWERMIRGTGASEEFDAGKRKGGLVTLSLAQFGKCSPM